MRTLLTLALFLGSAMIAPANTFVYVSLGSEQKIQVFRQEPKEGTLTAVETIAVEGTPGALTLDPKKKFLFATLRSTSTLASFAVDGTTGKLKPLSTVALPKGENAAYLATDRTGRWLISASYAAGKIVVHEIGSDGMLKSPAVQTVTTAKTAHCISIDPEGRFVFVPHVEPNAVYQFKLDTATGKLTEVAKVPGGSEKAGPRHMAWHPTLPMAFTSNEVENSITAYRFFAKDGLKPVQTLTTLPADFKDKNTTAEVKVHPNGKFVWVSNRGHDSLAGFAIDESGKLTSLGQTPTEKTPRSFDLSPDGRYLYAAGEGSGKLAAYRVDPTTGKLAKQQTYELGKSLSWVMAVGLGEK